MSEATPTIDSGWYPDPYDTGRLRYWSGTEWSHEVRPAGPGAGGADRPWWQQWWAIGLTLLVCFPFGLVGVWQRQGTPARVKVAVSAAVLLVYGGFLLLRRG